MRTGLTTLNRVLSPVALLTALPVTRDRPVLGSVPIGFVPAARVLIAPGLLPISMGARTCFPLSPPIAVAVVATLHNIQRKKEIATRKLHIIQQ